MLDLASLHRRARRVLPPPVESSEVVVDACDASTLCALLLPLRHRRQGRIVFRLAPDTVRGLGRKPLDYLQDAVRAREGLGRRRTPMRYTAWRQGGGDGGACFYAYSLDGRAALVLLPASAMAIYAWDDRGIATQLHGQAFRREDPQPRMGTRWT